MSCASTVTYKVRLRPLVVPSSVTTLVSPVVCKKAGGFDNEGFPSDAETPPQFGEHVAKSSLLMAWRELNRALQWKQDQHVQAHSARSGTMEWSECQTGWREAGSQCRLKESKLFGARSSGHGFHGLHGTNATSGCATWPDTCIP